jgi:chromate reductase, NAD(P)H dehydrogenase (quinone)
VKKGLFDANGEIGEASRLFFQNWMKRYAEWVKKHTPEQ